MKIIWTLFFFSMTDVDGIPACIMNDEHCKILSNITVVNTEKLENKSKLHANIFWCPGRSGFYTLSSSKYVLILLYSKSIIGDMGRSSCTE